MERWDIYTADRVKTGRTWPRGTELKDGDYHLVVHVCLFNEQGQMLIQQRQPFKEGWPNMWDLSVGGSATTGDTSQTAAERELFEELGLSLSFEGRRPQLTVPFEVGFDDYYLIETGSRFDDLDVTGRRSPNRQMGDGRGNHYRDSGRDIHFVS